MCGTKEGVIRGEGTGSVDLSRARLRIVVLTERRVY